MVPPASPTSPPLPEAEAPACADPAAQPEPLPASAPGEQCASDKDADKAPATRFIVERRTRGLLWSERTGCALATGVAVVPLGFFGAHMLPLLQQESGLMLLLLSITLVLGACLSVLLGIAVSVFVWWVPRMLYLALRAKVRRNGVRAGVRSRGIWVSGIGWMGWNGLHVREKSKPGHVGPCTGLVIKSPEQGELVLLSSENAPDLLRQIRRYLDAQATEFQNTELLPGQVRQLQPASLTDDETDDTAQKAA
jgi:hypothetical protein